MILEYFRRRRSVGWFLGAGLLGLVILAFVVLYFPDFMGDPATAALRQEVVWVNGQPITATRFLDRYRVRTQALQEQTGGSFTPTLARQIGLPAQVAAELAQERILLLEAERHGLTATDREVGQAIQSDPSLQIEGVFIGRQRYLDLIVNPGSRAVVEACVNIG